MIKLSHYDREYKFIKSFVRPGDFSHDVTKGGGDLLAGIAPSMLHRINF